MRSTKCHLLKFNLDQYQGRLWRQSCTNHMTTILSRVQRELWQTCLSAILLTNLKSRKHGWRIVILFVCYKLHNCINWAEICKDKINLNYNLIGSSWNDNFCCLIANIVYENLCVHGKCAIFVLTFLCLFCYLDMLIEIIKKKDRCIRLFRLKNHTFESISRENL